MNLWSPERLNRLFAYYNRKFWNAELNRWRAETSENHPGLYGFCDRKSKRVYVRLSRHHSDQEVRATLIHEMAHAATNSGHSRKWRTEMERLREAGAPTVPLDFLTPYSCRTVVTDFIDAARSEASWEEALQFVGPLHGLTNDVGCPISAKATHILRQAKEFHQAESKRACRSRTAAQSND